MVMTELDCLVSLLIGDADPDKIARNAILNTAKVFDETDNTNFESFTYTKMAASVASREGGRKWMCDVIFAVGFENNDDIEEC